MDNFEYYLSGSGDVTVVFFNGFRMPYKTWDKVYPAIEANNRVLLFNRLGVGDSSRAQMPQTAEVVVNEFRAWALNLDIKPPFVLVAHSLGGLFANLYARLFPDDVLGVVFVESPHPSEVAAHKAIKPPFLMSVINEGMKSVEKWFDPYKYSEDECVEESVRQIQAAGEFPDVPVTVVTGAEKLPFVPRESFEIHLQHQQELLAISSQSRQVLCKASGHFPQITESEIVLGAIQNLLQTVRSKTSAQKAH